MQTIVGTPMYLPPEMINKTKYGYKVDVWAIGILIYNMVIGQCPFRAKDIIQLGQSICNDKEYYDKNRWTNSLIQICS